MKRKIMQIMPATARAPLCPDRSEWWPQLAADTPYKVKLPLKKKKKKEIHINVHKTVRRCPNQGLIRGTKRC